MKHQNLVAYDNFEKELGLDENEYRRLKLKQVQHQINFIKERAGSDLRVLDLGSGNSKYLYKMEDEGILSQGYGVEVSKSRFYFAEKWKRDCGYNKIINFNEDILNFDYHKIGIVDLILGLDIVMQFLDPIELGSLGRVLKKYHNILSENGQIIIELLNVNNIPKGKTWEEFPEGDPWLFSLWDCEQLSDYCFKWEKTYVGRENNKVDRSSITLQIYDFCDFSSLLKSCGFNNVKAYSNWLGHPYTGKEVEYIIMAEK